MSFRSWKEIWASIHGGFRPMRRMAALSFFQFPLGNPEKPLVPYQVFPNAKTAAGVFSLLLLINAAKYNESRPFFFKNNKQFFGPASLKTEAYIKVRSDGKRVKIKPAFRNAVCRRIGISLCATETIMERVVTTLRAVNRC